jgi:hypothetical protein
MPSLRGPRTAARGHTLLELVVASVILAATLVPGLRMLRDGLEQSRRNEDLLMLGNLCVSKLEEHLCLAAAVWTEASVGGNFSAEGYATLRYTAVRSEQPANGGLVNQLMAVTVTTWQDSDGNSALSSGEPRVVLASKVAKLAKYQSEASGS